MPFEVVSGVDRGMGVLSNPSPPSPDGVARDRGRSDDCADLKPNSIKTRHIMENRFNRISQ